MCASVTSIQISERGSHVLTLQTGSDLQLSFSEVLPADIARPTSLVFVSEIQLFQQAIERKVLGIIIKETLWSEVQKQNLPEVQIWSTANIQFAMVAVLPLFDSKTQFFKPGIHPTAAIHPLALIDPSAHVGAHCTVEAYAVVGADSILYPSTYVGSYCQVGARCIIGPLTSLGADGFGFVTDKKFKHSKIPQVGRVVIEDDCELGAHCAVDRATLTETRIRKGSKLDNFCHIAHNVEIGENAMIAGGFMVAGSTRIGKNFMSAGSVAVTGHLQITDNVILAGRSAVTANINEPGLWGGFPLEPQRENLKTLATLPYLKNMRKQLNKILKHLNLEQE